MAMTKRNKIQSEIEKARLKLVEQQARIKELEAKSTKLENMEIVDIVRGMDISLDDLAAVLQSLKGGYTPALPTSGMPVPQDRLLTPKSTTPKNDDTDKEDEPE